MRTVWKYKIVPGLNEITMPFGARPLYANIQDGHIHLWCEVNTQANPKQKRLFQAYGTGHEVDWDAKYIDSVQFMEAGTRLVLHVYEKVSGRYETV